jgi:sulfite reductase beta subunit-like hemoprotein
VEATLDRLIDAWIDERTDGETFRDFAIRKTDEELQSIAKGEAA